ncbi:MAG: type VI secretion system-associated protein TagF [Thioalkalispiraceae bacterium]
METERQIGVYGKLPVHGDFVHRNLPRSFISIWDDWLQIYIAGSKEQIGEEWLDIYLTSPIWRFVLSAGVIDGNQWAGIMLPSVDQVGRYYPFTIVLPIPSSLSPFEYISLHAGWYEKIEDLALQALEQELVVDDLLDEINKTKTDFSSSYEKTGQLMEANGIQINMEFEEQLPMSVYPYMLDSVLTRTFNSYSAWATQGSERVSPSLFAVKGLPVASNIPAMMDGQWAYWGWPQTYAAK